MDTRTYSYIISWKKWNGKTLFATILASWYEEIYSNYTIKDAKNERFISYIQNWDDIFSLQNRRSKKGVLIIDEAQKRLNRRDSMTTKNKDMGWLLVLTRKANLDLFIIPQKFKRLDEQIVEQVDYRYKLLQSNKYFNNYGKVEIDLKFEVYEQLDSDDSVHPIWNIIRIEEEITRALTCLKELGLSYDTNDSVIMSYKKKVKSEKVENKNLIEWL